MSYRTEEEQLELIKIWWKRYGSLVTLVFSLLLLSIAGYKYWTWRESNLLAQASVAYEQMMSAFANQNDKAVKVYGKQLIEDYPKTVYADAAKLTIAKILVSENELDKAKTILLTVAKTAKLPAFKQTARIRVARLLAAQKGYDKALKTLTIVEDKAYMPLINEVKGDIFAATGHYEKALLSYKQAISEVKTHGMGTLFLEMKTNELLALAHLNKYNSNTQAA